MTILLIILYVLTGLLYGVDLFWQSSCDLVHYDQSFLVSLLTGINLFRKEMKLI